VIKIKKAHSSEEVEQRSVYNQIFQEVRKKKFNAILTWGTRQIKQKRQGLGIGGRPHESKFLHEIPTYPNHQPGFI
jgi:ribosomal protein L44E